MVDLEKNVRYVIVENDARMITIYQKMVDSLSKETETQSTIHQFNTPDKALLFMIACAEEGLQPAATIVISCLEFGFSRGEVGDGEDLAMRLLDDPSIQLAAIYIVSSSLGDFLITDSHGIVRSLREYARKKLRSGVGIFAMSEHASFTSLEIHMKKLIRTALVSEPG